MKINKSKILEIRNLNVKYGSNQKSTIKNFKLDLFKGDHLAIIGPSGCGKTTFAKTIVNMPPKGSITKGFIKISGEDLTKIENLLSNVSFLDKAPKEVIVKNENLKKQFLTKIKEINEIISN